MLKAPLTCACHPSCLSTPWACVAVVSGLVLPLDLINAVKRSRRHVTQRRMQHRAVPCEEEEEGESVTQGEKKGDCRYVLNSRISVDRQAENITTIEDWEDGFIFLL